MLARLTQRLLHALPGFVTTWSISLLRLMCTSSAANLIEHSCIVYSTAAFCTAQSNQIHCIKLYCLLLIICLRWHTSHSSEGDLICSYIIWPWNISVGVVSDKQPDIGRTSALYIRHSGCNSMLIMNVFILSQTQSFYSRIDVDALLVNTKPLHFWEETHSDCQYLCC